MKLKRDDISDRVIQRLTKYLSILHDMKKYEEYINSSELSKIMNTTSAQIRRDLSTFGEFGIRGKGYDIENLISIIERILGIDRINKVILVGHGKVGEMLTSNTEVLGKSFNIVEVFDKSPSKVGKEIKDLNIKIKDIKDIDSDLGKINVDTAILSVIKEQAQIVTDILVKNHIKGILNFTTYKLETPDDVAVVDVNISANLQELNFWKDMLKNKGE
ncbi:Redox-sensing transcriptional repressor rex [Sebaldella termitidis]|jgi:redox-sensing transcriptional repressor|uniref:Redox-sensing transcriptional repressor Rex n=1 Tax=Sebaldella termitidis (strain ATCC 33386 / NCTC 11300) TaxID=526218 RepID=D1AH11_SEBTE|nr:redox-sensing transcriptional repressor Rex [Sebaldella termitidis]ACZ08045.1 Rex DNA-binding domain protein [Sebaldella termitidis ATCC 33386]MBP7979504.1 redox-sensing transcriptional repressor Rex [Sebaldella sp.]MDR2879848.1 redox-sensing transcriptional repressor Rex [Fusobacteriales bacterium]SUI23346.1 Redox-sensing transcriptional repressor rex [Sebaldella termitidis]